MLDRETVQEEGKTEEIDGTVELNVFGQLSPIWVIVRVIWSALSKNTYSLTPNSDLATQNIALVKLGKL